MLLRLHNVGPIRDAAVELGALTVLVGPNGSGKTILSSVAYAAQIAARQAAIYSSRLVAFRMYEATTPEELESARRLAIGRWEERFRDVLERELRRCCSADLSLLRREYRAGRWAAPRITVETDASERSLFPGGWALVFRIDKDRLVVERTNALYRAPVFSDEAPELDSPMRVDRRLRTAFRGGLPGRAFYFPASRSGFMQTFNTLTALVFGALGGGYFEEATVGKIPGTAADFLRFIAQVETRQRSDLPDDALRQIEKRLLKGEIILEDGGPSREVKFRPDGFAQDYSIETAATSAAEIAPLVLYLRHQAAAGDAVFIDEPEAHLHPSNQVALARSLMCMANTLHTVVVATHSDFLVSALSNEVMRYVAESPGRVRRSPVAVYVFTVGSARSGARVEQLDFDPEHGFDIEQFSTVTEETYDESISIHNQLHGE